jgi:hypothetical protein
MEIQQALFLLGGYPIFCLLLLMAIMFIDSMAPDDMD